MREPWLRTNGVNTNGAAAKVMNFGTLGEKVHPGTFGKTQVGLSGVPKKSLCQTKSAATPLVLTPFVPFQEPSSSLRIASQIFWSSSSTLLLYSFCLFHVDVCISSIIYYLSVCVCLCLSWWLCYCILCLLTLSLYSFFVSLFICLFIYPLSLFIMLFFVSFDPLAVLLSEGRGAGSSPGAGLPRASRMYFQWPWNG